MLNISQAMAVRVLKGLSDKGVVKIIGGGKNTRYISSGTNALLQAGNMVAERGNGYGYSN